MTGMGLVARTASGPALRRVARAMVDLALPPQALDGAAAGPVQAAGLTPERWSRIRFIEAPFCDACGTPFEYDIGPGALCVLCQAEKRDFVRLRAACLYDETSRDLILKLKHADRTDLASLFAIWLARAAADLLAQADLIVPAPLHRWRLLHRRFNQAAEIARPLSRLCGVPCLADGLDRRRATASQAGKSALGRRRNVAAAFAVPPQRRARIAGRRVLLIDDVFTTGATAGGCARALLAAGAAAVDVAVIARVELRAPRG